MNKQDQIDRAKDIIKDRQVAITKYCYCTDCKNCPASWENSEDKVSCFTSKRYKIEWLENWLKENDTTQIVKDTDVVISRELLDEIISCLSDYDNEIADELFIKLYHLRG